MGTAHGEDTWGQHMVQKAFRQNLRDTRPEEHSVNTEVERGS